MTMPDLCRIAVPASPACTMYLGHLGRCTWDRGPAVDPVYDTEGAVNLLRLPEGDKVVVDLGREHGSRYLYRKGCRCLACENANTEYQREYRAARR